MEDGQVRRYMMNDMQLTHEQFLKHYGILGMKWGIRRYQPYPTKGGPKGRYVGEKTTHTVRSNKQQAIRNASSTANAIGLGLAVSRLSPARPILSVVDSGSIRSAINKNKEFKRNDELSKKMNVDQIVDKVVKKVNPTFGLTPGSTSNCLRATIAYEMRRRGYDVKATGALYGTGQSVLGMTRLLDDTAKNATYGPARLLSGNKKRMDKALNDSTDKYHKVAKSMEERRKNRIYTREISRTDMDITSVFTTKEQKFNEMSKAANSIFNGLSKQPNGSRGDLSLVWAAGGAHSVAYEILNGKPIIVDAQIGKVYTKPEHLISEKYLVDSARITRLDNKQFSDDILKRWVKNA